MQCPFFIQIRCSPDGQTLMIKSIIDEHNHEISQKTFVHLPRQRRLDKDTLEQTKNMLNVKANKKMVQDHIYKSGKVVTLKDLHNIAYKENKSIVDAQALLEEMRKVDGKIKSVGLF